MKRTNRVYPQSYVRASSDNSQISIDDIKSAIKECKEYGAKCRIKGDYVRYTSFEDDFVSYNSLSDMVAELNSTNMSYDDIMEDPGQIFDYGQIDSLGISMSSEVPEYRQFKKEMNAKLGF